MQGTQIQSHLFLLKQRRSLGPDLGPFVLIKVYEGHIKALIKLNKPALGFDKALIGPLNRALMGPPDALGIASPRRPAGGSGQPCSIASKVEMVPVFRRSHPREAQSRHIVAGVHSTGRQRLAQIAAEETGPYYNPSKTVLKPPSNLIKTISNPS